MSTACFAPAPEPTPSRLNRTLEGSAGDGGPGSMACRSTFRTWELASRCGASERSPSSQRAFGERLKPADAATHAVPTIDSSFGWGEWWGRGSRPVTPPPSPGRTNSPEARSTRTPAATYCARSAGPVRSRRAAANAARSHWRKANCPARDAQGCKQGPALRRALGGACWQRQFVPPRQALQERTAALRGS